MKRIISLLICLTMILSSISVFAAVPFELNTITVTYAENASESSGIVVSGKYDKPLVLRVFNDTPPALFMPKRAKKHEKLKNYV